MNGGTSVNTGAVLDSGTVLNLVATPATDYEFEKWWDNNTNAVRNLTLTQNVTISATFKLKDDVFIAGQIDKDRLTIYPNPVVDVLNIQTEEVIKQIVVLDLNGKVMMQLQGNYKTLNLQSVPTGNYILRIHTETTIVPVKIVKQ
jgi:hypothetical protein